MPGRASRRRAHRDARVLASSDESAWGGKRTILKVPLCVLRLTRGAKRVDARRRAIP
jgi:hypothetical protein